MKYVSQRRRIAQLEKCSTLEHATRARKRCNCRLGGVTRHHSTAELQDIMALGCPVHKVRDLGSIEWVPEDVPIDFRDKDFCSCPPDIWRDHRLGKRELPTGDEQQAYRQKQWKKFHELATPESQQKLQREIALTEQLIKKYEKARGEAHGHNV